MQFEKARILFKKHPWLHQQLLGEAQWRKLSLRTYVETKIGRIAIRPFRALKLNEAFGAGMETLKSKMRNESIIVFTRWDVYVNEMTDPLNPKRYATTPGAFRPTSFHSYIHGVDSRVQTNLRELIGHYSTEHSKVVAIVRCDGISDEKRRDLLAVDLDVFFTGRGVMRNSYPQTRRA
jgi:hypothetical protein